MVVPVKLINLVKMIMKNLSITVKWGEKERNNFEIAGDALFILVLEVIIRKVKCESTIATRRCKILPYADDVDRIRKRVNQDKTKYLK